MTTAYAEYPSHIRYYPHVTPLDGERYNDYHSRAAGISELWEWRSNHWVCIGGKTQSKTEQASIRAEWGQGYVDVMRWTKDSPRREKRSGPQYGRKRRA
jgi:hypothetical protein